MYSDSNPTTLKSKMPFFLTLSALFHLSAPKALANKTTFYEGEAKLDGKTVYLEKHEVLYDDAGKLLQAITRYQDPAGKPIADLQSDFRQSLTVPNHTVKDFRTGNIQGLRREQDKVILFDQDRDKPERTRILNDSDADNRVLVGCQGLNYYLLGNLQAIDPDKPLPLRFLIPGKLDYYDFILNKTAETPEGLVSFEIAIQNWFLKIFAPKLIVKYDKTMKRIAWYQGLSNITNEKGENQVVTITYRYDSPTKL